MPTFTRPAPTNLLGTPSAPAAVAAGGTATSTALDLGASGSTSSGLVVAVATLAAPLPTSNPVVQFQFSLDGTNWYVDDTVPVPLTAGTYTYTWSGPAQARFLRVVVLGGTGNPITASAQGTPLGVA